MNLPYFQAGPRLIDGSALNKMVDMLNGQIDFFNNVFYVDPVNGNDSVGTPFKTITAAYNRCTAGKNDCVVIVGDGGTAASIRLSSTLVWAKNATHLIGITAPTMIAQRARITPATSLTTNLNPMITVSASGCIFANFSLFQGTGEASADENLIQVTGSRNYFWNVQFGGMGAQVGADRAGSYLIYLNGGGENLFEGCSIGLETIQRAAANASVRVRSGGQRNMFVNCQFQMAADATSPLFVDVNATNALNGSSLIFRECSFMNLVNITGAQQPAVTATVAADANGTVFFDRCSTMAAKWAAASALVKVASIPVSDGFNGGVFANAADS